MKFSIGQTSLLGTTTTVSSPLLSAEQDGNNQTRELHAFATRAVAMILGYHDVDAELLFNRHSQTGYKTLVVKDQVHKGGAPAKPMAPMAIQSKHR